MFPLPDLSTFLIEACSMKLFALTLLILSLSFAPAVPLGAQNAAARETVITSVRLEMQGTDDRNYFYFTEDVQVRGTNLDLSCEELTVVAMREGPGTGAVGEIGAIEKIVALGSVEIHQAGRSAYAGRAEVNPSQGTVTLMDSPRIVDGEVEVEGFQFVLHRGEKKFVSIPDPNAPDDEPGRSVVRLGAMPDLGFDQTESEITVDDQLDAEPGPSVSDPPEAGSGEDLDEPES